MTTALEHVVHYTGARQPPIYGTLVADDSLIDPLPSGATVDFSMRPVGSTTPKVNHASAVIDDLAANTVHYAWASGDVDTPGFYVGWWRVTLPAGGYAESPEFLIEIRDHAPAVSYVSPAELKQTLALKADYADADILDAVQAASRAIDSRLGRSFVLGSAGEARTYETVSPAWVDVDDLTTITSVVVNGVTLTQNVDYQAIAAGVGRPITSLEAIGSFVFPTRSRVIVVTGTYGWTSVPPEIKTATKIVATRLLRRSREAAFGVVGLGFEGAAVHIARFDPDLDLLLSDFEDAGGSLAQG